MVESECTNGGGGGGLPGKLRARLRDQAEARWGERTSTALVGVAF